MRIPLTLVLFSALQAGNLLRAQTAPGDLKATVLSQHPFKQQQLTESSGLVSSRTQPGILWSLNDSGNPPELFAIDTLGEDRGTVRVQGAENQDWEALGIARCGNHDCLYAADVGDNRLRRNPVRVYRIREPRAGIDSLAAIDAILEISYPDQPHDVEAILVTATQDVFLITKTSTEGPLVYRVPGSAWSRGPGQATLTQTLTIPSNDGIAFLVTDGSLSPDGRRVVLRTYRYLYFYSFDGEGLTPESRGFRCDATGLELQGEGVTWLRGDTLATSSERVALVTGGVSRIVCRP